MSTARLFAKDWTGEGGGGEEKALFDCASEVGISAKNSS